MDIYAKVHKAAKRYLEMTDHRVIYDDFMDMGLIIMKDDNGIAVADVKYNVGKFPNNAKNLKRDVFEDVVHKFFLQEHDVVDVPIRYDTIHVNVLSDDRALIRHCVDAKLED